MNFDDFSTLGPYWHVEQNILEPVLLFDYQLPLTVSIRIGERGLQDESSEVGI